MPRFSSSPLYDRASDRFSGLLLVDKPAGPTSHDIVARVRRQFCIEKVGHGGTLDPNATGLLILLLGRATRLSDRIMGSDKTYVGTLRLGRTTNTQDADGQIISEHPYDTIRIEQVKDVIAAMQGDLRQIPPMVSAIKVKGVPLYKLARKGEEIAREARLVHIYKFQLNSWQPPLVEFEVVCSKGTYIRTLCHDLGMTLGCGASMENLRRTTSGKFNVNNAIPFDELLKFSREELANHIIPFATAAAIL
jgi:tRNA pseudouridine55 synthase